MHMAKKGLCVALMVSVFAMPFGCSDPPEPLPDEALETFFDDTSGPPEPTPRDQAMRAKADVIVLPTISVTVWAIGALVVYMGTQEVFRSSLEDLQYVLGQALEMPTSQQP